MALDVLIQLSLVLIRQHLEWLRRCSYCYYYCGPRRSPQGPFPTHCHYSKHASDESELLSHVGTPTICCKRLAVSECGVVERQHHHADLYPILLPHGNSSSELVQPHGTPGSCSAWAKVAISSIPTMYCIHGMHPCALYRPSCCTYQRPQNLFRFKLACGRVVRVRCGSPCPCFMNMKDESCDGHV